MINLGTGSVTGGTLTSPRHIIWNTNILNKTYVLIIGDRSGSVQTRLSDIVGGYNSFLHDQQKLDNVYVTLVLFDDNYEVAYKDVNCK